MVGSRVPKGVRELVSPSGVVGSVIQGQPPRGLGRARILSADLGSGRPGRHPSARRILGHARLLDDEDLGYLVAVAEAAERYAGSDLYTTPFRGTLAELDGPVIDISRIPRCSEREYANPDCPLVPLDADAPIRWLRGVDLRSGEMVWAPAMMVCYGCLPDSPAERFWHHISTGYAIHSDPREAMVRAILEVVERDIISLLWLQKLPLPALRLAERSEDLMYLQAWSDRRFIDTYLFDATSDLGIPTVYCLQIAEHDPLARHAAGCATGRTLLQAAEKALLDVITARPLFYSGEELVTEYREFVTIREGARFMARPEQADAFEFLVDDTGERGPSLAHHELPEDSEEALRVLSDIFSERDMQVILYDRTPHEVSAAGLTAAVALIPDLQPMSLHPLVQYRGHTRLYDAPAKMGYRTLPEEELNPWPQPFA